MTTCLGFWLTIFLVTHKRQALIDQAHVNYKLRCVPNPHRSPVQKYWTSTYIRWKPCNLNNLFAFAKPLLVHVDVPVHTLSLNRQNYRPAMIISLNGKQCVVVLPRYVNKLYTIIFRWQFGMVGSAKLTRLFINYKRRIRVCIVLRYFLSFATVGTDYVPTPFLTTL